MRQGQTDNKIDTQRLGQSENNDERISWEEEAKKDRQ